jgi:hypothetical protein
MQEGDCMHDCMLKRRMGGGMYGLNIQVLTSARWIAVN